MESLSHKLVAILYADVKSYSQHMGRDEDGTVRRLNTCLENFNQDIINHRGRIADTAGDAIVAEFGSVQDAVTCAVVVQTNLREKNEKLPEEQQLVFRIGVNMGDVVSQGEDILGDAINIAARLESIADPGGIYLSGLVYDSVKNKLEFSYQYMGEQSLKNIVEPVRAYKVLLTGDEVQAPITSATAVPLAIPEIPSIAVLPFDNMSADPEQEYFSDGITEDILTDLSKLSGLLVISRHSTFVYKGKSVSAQQISRDLGVRYVLEGSVRKAGNRIRITAQLIDATIDDHIWADRFDRELEDIFALQDEVSRIIVDALKLNLTDLEEQRLGHKGTDNIMAHDYLIQAREQFFLFTPKGITNALELCSHAIEIDPNYAEAYALKSRLLIFPYAVSANLTLEETVIPAVVSAKKAIELDDLLPLAHASLGWALMWNREIEVAISEGKRAVTLDPNFADGHMWLSLIYSSAGKGDEALESIEKAVRLNPYYGVVYLFAHGLANFVLGQYEKALSFFTKGIEDSPNYVPLYIFRTGILGLLDRKEEAHSSADELVKLSPHYNGYVATIFNDKQMMETLDKGFKKAGLETQIRNFKI